MEKKKELAMPEREENALLPVWISHGFKSGKSHGIRSGHNNPIRDGVKRSMLVLSGLLAV
jgi:hypothetical protein